MYKTILKIFLVVFGLFATLRGIDFAAFLADQNSDLAVLGALGILLLIVFMDALFFHALFIKHKSKENTDAN